MKHTLVTIGIIATLGCQPVQLHRTPVEPKTTITTPVPLRIIKRSHDLLDGPGINRHYQCHVDVDRDLARSRSWKSIEDACKQYRDGDHSEQLDCAVVNGCSFMRALERSGIPSHLLEFFQHWYQPYFGPSFSSMGFVPNPNSNDSMPIGLSESTQRMGSIKVHAFTCASCHFGQMPDGRYAVGYPNNQLDYGRFFASMVALMKLSINPNDDNIHPLTQDGVEHRPFRAPVNSMDL